VRTFNNLKVISQLAIGFSVVIALLVTLGGLSIFEIASVNNRVAQLRDHWLPGVRASMQMQAALLQVRMMEYRIVTSTSAVDISKADEQLEKAIAAYNRAIAEYRPLASEPRERAALAEVQRFMRQYLADDSDIRQAARQGNLADAEKLMRNQPNETRSGIVSNLSIVLAANEDGARRDGIAANVAFRQAIVFVICCIVGAVAMGACLATMISRDLANRLGGEPGDAATIAKKIATGDLTVRVNVGNRNPSSLMSSLAAMKDQLTGLLSDIKSHRQSILDASNEISQSNGDLSHRTEEQSASLQEAAANLTQLRARVHQNAENAKHAEILARSTSDMAASGTNKMNELTRCVQRFAESSARITQIVSLIEGIAFQTNILALNAAVEAARAGDHGRGFAVVAGEVRGLAQRSSSALREIKLIILESQERIDNGGNLAFEAEVIIGKMAHSAKKVTDLMCEISNASSEQRAGIDEVCAAVSQIDHATQRNAAFVEEAFSAVQTLTLQTNGLEEALSVFQIDLHASPSGVLK
jgi:methyl-accepting chemotaxis protein